MLVCSLCKKEKPEIDFHRNSSASSGRDNRCIPCKKERRDAVRRTEEYRAFDKSRAKAWKENNPELYIIGRHTRRVKEKLQIASWVRNNPEELKKISMIYKHRDDLKEAFGIDFHGDHIVPLNNKLVCGLTCSANLEILTKEANLAKGNRHWPDMPENHKALLQELESLNDR